MSGNLGTGFAQSGFSNEPNVSPFNQWFSNAVLVILTRLGVYPPGSGGGGTGSVTAVTLTDASATPIYLESGGGGPTSGTVALVQTLNTESKNLVFSGPTSGAAAQPTFRALVTADLPAGVSTSTGSVTSVSGTDASTSQLFGISGVPITTSGTFTMTLVTQAKNLAFLGPSSGANAQPTFRAIAAGDVPHFIDFAFDQVFYSMAGGF
jgi:hypothetical protein